MGLKQDFVKNLKISSVHVWYLFMTFKVNFLKAEKVRLNGFKILASFTI